jgi:hypothetical protein
VAVSKIKDVLTRQRACCVPMRHHVCGQYGQRAMVPELFRSGLEG